MLTIVSRKTYWARTSAWSRSFSSQSAAAAATALTSSGSSASEGSWNSAPTSWPFRLTSWRRRGPPSPENSVPSGRTSCCPVRKPVDEVERRVAERVREGVAERGAAAELDEQVGDADPREPAAEHAGEEGDRHEPRTRRGRRSRGSRPHPPRTCPRSSWTIRTPITSAPVPRTGPSARRRAPLARRKRVTTIASTARTSPSANTLMMPVAIVCAVSLFATAIVLSQLGQSASGCSSTRSWTVEATKTRTYVVTTSQRSLRPWRRPRRVREQQVDERAEREAVDQAARSSRPSRCSTPSARPGTRGTRRGRGAGRCGCPGRRQSAITPDARNESPTVRASERNAALFSRWLLARTSAVPIAHSTRPTPAMATSERVLIRADRPAQSRPTRLSG